MLGSPEHIRQWEEARCPICLEHPHNAVLLRCSSYDNGCRIFMCNTSTHHSNCLDQFRKSPEPSPSSFIVPRIFGGHTDRSDGESEDTLTCPMCRGQVYGWFVIESARQFMNSKTRSCSTETCKFVGNYMELRKHARADHPTIRPSVVDPERQQNWTMLENEIDLSNLLNLGLDGNEEEETVILDEIDTEVDNTNIGFVADNNVAFLDDILYFGSIILFADWLRTSQGNDYRDNRSERLPSNNTDWLRTRQRNYYRDNRSRRLSLPNNVRYNFRGRNNNYISRYNNSFSGRYDNNVILNNVSNNLNSRQNDISRERISRNNRDDRHNDDNNNLNPRQNNSFRGNNTQRMRDTRLNSTRRNNNGRNVYDRSGRGNASR
ncbi:uncharacterized protein [Euphorbia lathyris]|uniref:uncharacterized protein n=1 Tax=Euphorbia lathyris TaxID=212925 RepID=UPI0033139112